MVDYNPNIPQPGDNISVSQGQILNNFTQLNTQFAIDHFAFNTGSGNGDGHHKQVTFDTPSVAAAPTGTQSMIYPDLVSGKQELFFQNASNFVQLTNNGNSVWNSISSSTTGEVLQNIANPGYMLLPNGLLLKWGAIGTVNNGTIITFDATKTFTNLFSLIVSVSGDNTTSTSAVWVQTIAANKLTFTVGVSRANVPNVSYFAIGN